MFKIIRFPSKLKSFFDSSQNRFHYNHFQYFQMLVVLMAFSWGRRNITTLYRHLDRRNQTHRSRFNNFIGVGRCDYAAVLQMKAYELLDLLKLGQGETIELILDDSKKQKRGKRMEAVGWIRDPLTGKSIRGHQFVTATVNFRGYTIPLGIRIYIKKEDCRSLGRPFKKTTQLAAELISGFEPPQAVNVRVLFDSYYLCPVVVKECRKKGFRFVSTLKSNRNLFKNGRKLKTGQYGKSTFVTHKKKTFCIRKSNGIVKYAYVDAGWMDVGKIGKLHVIFSRKKADPKILGLVTDDPNLSASQMIKTYDNRWSIEIYQSYYLLCHSSYYVFERGLGLTKSVA